MKRRTLIRLGVQTASALAALPMLQGCGSGESGAESALATNVARRRAAGLLAPPRTYSAPAAATIYGGRFGTALLDLIAAAPPNPWIQANTNTFVSAWGDPDLIAGGGGDGSESPSAVIRCWSSFAWDSARSRLVLYGGGHGNYDGNEVYTWSGDTRRWSLAYHSSEVQRGGGGLEYVTVDAILLL